MNNRRSIGVQAALDLVRTGQSIRSSARQIGVHITSVRRAMREEGEPPRLPGYPHSMRQKAPPATDAEWSSSADNVAGTGGSAGTLGQTGPLQR